MRKGRMKMKEWNIAVIGCGALGKRHLESILKSELPLKVYCVDINAQVFSGEFFGGGGKKKMRLLQLMCGICQK